MSLDIKDFEVLEEIGRGQFGVVKKVRLRSRPDRICVWKELNYSFMNNTERRQLQSEIQLLQSLDHEFIVKYLGRIQIPEQQKVFILMEFCDGGDLATYLDHTVRKGIYIAEDVILRWFAQLVDALHYCHNRAEGVVFHRDVKPQNTLMSRDCRIVKLGDFGLAKALAPKQTLTQTHVGTPYYMAPEVMTRNTYDTKCDIWSFGCLLYETLTGKSPFAEATSMQSLKNLVGARTIKPLPQFYNKELFSLIKWMLTIDPLARPGTSELRSTLAFKMGALLMRLDDQKEQIAQYRLHLRQSQAALYLERKRRNASLGAEEDPTSAGQ